MDQLKRPRCPAANRSPGAPATPPAATFAGRASRLQAILPLAAIVTLLLLAGCRPAVRPDPVPLEGKTMGTTWHLTLAHPATDAEAMRSFVQRRLDELDLAFTNWRPSPVTRFNESRDAEWRKVPRELAEMVTLARELSAATAGAFDITLAPVVDLWGFGPKGRVKTPPSDEAIAAALKHVDWRKVEARLDPPALRKLDPELAINVSAMADGYACDDVAKLLRARGMTDFLLEIGGAVLAAGSNAEGRPWQAGIQRPHAATGDTVTTIALRDQALSTSGVYRQYFESAGKRYAHVLDARTGRPVEHDLVSVSVTGPSAFQADGWDTALLILGPETGRELAGKLGLEALFLTGGDRSR